MNVIIITMKLSNTELEQKVNTEIFVVNEEFSVGVGLQKKINLMEI